MRFGAFVLAAAVALAGPAHAVVRGKPVPALALYGEPKYGPGFTHFDYANPDAPKGGTFTKVNENYDTFDTFNPFTVKGAAAHGAEMLQFETLMTPSQDEPMSVYGLIAETAEVAPDNSWVQFVIRAEAKFSDGAAVTPEDVVFSFETLTAKGFPRFKSMFADVEKVTTPAPRTVRFSFKATSNRKLPILIAEYLPILSKTYWKDRDFAATTLAPPISTGPYAIESFEAGRHLIYRRRDDYWGKDLAVNRGLWNFERVRFEYYRDDDVMFEAFKTGAHDFLRIYSARRWVQGFDFPAAHDGRVVKFEFRTINPINVQPLVLNLRRPMFKDRRVREAINATFDFESLNANLFRKQYVAVRSYWQGSPLAATGLPGPDELKLLEPLRDRIPPEVFTAEFNQPATKGDGNARESLLKARELLLAAGWELRDGVLTEKATGTPLRFEIIYSQQGLDRSFLPMTQNLRRLGIDAKLRLIDTPQLINRLNSYDFDSVMVSGPPYDLTPGPELEDYWSSASADRPAGYNYSGVKDPAVDALVSNIVGAETYEDLTAAAKALDRVLTWNFYQILTYSGAEERFAYWTRLEQPKTLPALGLGKMGGFSTFGMGETAIALWWANPNAPSAAQTASGKDATRGWIVGLVGVGIVMLVWILMRRRKPGRP